MTGTQDLTSYAHAASTWAQRAQAELGAKQRLRELVIYLDSLDASESILKMTLKAIEDENRHALLCSEVAKNLGHKTGYELPAEQNIETKKPWKNEKSKTAALCEVVMMCCLTETINASLLANILTENNLKSRMGRIVKAILEDEMQHGQLGWALLRQKENQLDLSAISGYLPAMLDICVKDELFNPVAINQSDGGDADGIYKFGVMPLEHRLDQFSHTLQEVVVPGLQLFKINTTPIEVWLENKLNQPI